MRTLESSQRPYLLNSHGSCAKVYLKVKPTSKFPLLSNYVCSEMLGAFKAPRDTLMLPDQQERLPSHLST